MHMIAACAGLAAFAAACSGSGGLPAEAAGLAAAYTGARGPGNEARRGEIINALAALKGDGADGALEEIGRNGEAGDREKALQALVEKKSPRAVPMLISKLLNSVQTGGDGKAETGAINSIDPLAIEKNYHQLMAKYEQAKLDDMPTAAREYFQNASILHQFLGKKSKREEMKERTRELEELGIKKTLDNYKDQYFDALEAGQLSKAYEIAKKAYDLSPHKSELSEFLENARAAAEAEDRFYAVAGAMDQAKSAYDDAQKRGEKGAGLEVLKRTWEEQRSAMVMAKRNLDRERQKMGACVQSMKKAGPK
jgi:hypothetical protein